ncbi:MAG: DUF805 domain-containing protein [Alphaproteobacteria bacterium]|nr:DUF805 domain-containing protein [Alphaproteobacteria bacterium]
MTFRQKLHFLFDPRGRASRRQLWLNLAVMVPLWPAVILLRALFFHPEWFRDCPQILNTTINRVIPDALFFIWYLSHLAFILRRFHDSGRKGWHLIGLMVTDYFLSQALRYYEIAPPAFTVAMIAPQIYATWVRYRLYVQPGDAKKNTYGPPIPQTRS